MAMMLLARVGWASRAHRSPRRSLPTQSGQSPGTAGCTRLSESRPSLRIAAIDGKGKPDTPPHTAQTGGHRSGMRTLRSMSSLPRQLPLAIPTFSPRRYISWHVLYGTFFRYTGGLVSMLKPLDARSTAVHNFRIKSGGVDVCFL